MFALFTKALDRVVIRMACAAQSKPGTFAPHLEEAAQLLQTNDLFGGPVKVPGDLKWTSPGEFEFSSAVSSCWEENNIVYGKLTKVADDWQSRPTVVLIHGWNDELGYAWRHPYQTRKMIQEGLNVAMLELPYHMRRRPRGPGAVNDFLSEDVHCTVRAVQQAVSDIRALLAWLHAQGCTRTGLLGVSLGGWLTGLVTCHDPRVQFSVMNVPVMRMDRAVQELPFCAPLRRSLKGMDKERTIDFEKLNVRFYRPKTPLENILLIEAVDDLFASKEAIEELWEIWGRPEIWRVRHAHISGLFAAPLLKRQVKWIAGKTLAK